MSAEIVQILAFSPAGLEPRHRSSLLLRDLASVLVTFHLCQAPTYFFHHSAKTHKPIFTLVLCQYWQLVKIHKTMNENPFMNESEMNHCCPLAKLEADHTSVIWPTSSWDLSGFLQGSVMG